MWDTWLDFLAPGLDLAKAWMTFRHLGSKPANEISISLSLTLPFKQVKLIFKVIQALSSMGLIFCILSSEKTRFLRKRRAFLETGSSVPIKCSELWAWESVPSSPGATA